MRMGADIAAIRLARSRRHGNRSFAARPWGLHRRSLRRYVLRPRLQGRLRPGRTGARSSTRRAAVFGWIARAGDRGDPPFCRRALSPSAVCHARGRIFRPWKSGTCLSAVRRSGSSRRRDLGFR